MGAARKLQQEIEQVLKKVREGIHAFDDIHDKVRFACSERPVEQSTGTFNMCGAYCATVVLRLHTMIDGCVCSVRD